MSFQNALRISSKTSKPTATIIFFHGLGDSGHGWKFLADEARKSSDFDHIKFILPNAPSIPIHANGNYPMPGWFDIYEIGDPNVKQDVKGYFQALNSVESLIEDEIKSGIDSQRIILGGFSQGGGLTIGSTIHLKQKLGGFIAFSPFTPPVFLEALKESISGEVVNKATPIFHGQGDIDQIVRQVVSDDTHKVLTKELGFTNYKYNVYRGLEHSVAPEELKTTFEFIKSVLPK